MGRHEITLRGKVLPIGGVKEKLLAAYRAGIKNVIVPKDNEKDMEEIPEEIKEAFNIIFVEEMDEVLRVAFVENIFLGEDGSAAPPKKPIDKQEGRRGSVTH